VNTQEALPAYLPDKQYGGEESPQPVPRVVLAPGPQAAGREGRTSRRAVGHAELSS